MLACHFQALYLPLVVNIHTTDAGGAPPTGPCLLLYTGLIRAAPELHPLPHLQLTPRSSTHSQPWLMRNAYSPVSLALGRITSAVSFMVPSSSWDPDPAVHLQKPQLWGSCLPYTAAFSPFGSQEGALPTSVTCTGSSVSAYAAKAPT